MKFRKHILFTLLFASILLFVACGERVEEHKESYDCGKPKSKTTYSSDFVGDCEIRCFNRERKYENDQLIEEKIYQGNRIFSLR